MTISVSFICSHLLCLPKCLHQPTQPECYENGSHICPHLVDLFPCSTLFRSSTTLALISSLIVLTSGNGLPLGSASPHSSVSTNVAGHTPSAPQPMVTPTSAWPTMSGVSAFGLLPLMSMPTSRMASTIG